MTEQTRVWAEKNLTGNALTGILAALEFIPSHRAPRIQLDSQSPWGCVDAIPGPRLAVWLATGDVYRVNYDGAVGNKPIILGKEQA